MNMKIFIILKDLHAKIPGLTMLDFFSYLADKVWNIENMIVLYAVSDWSHVSRLDSPFSLRLIVDFNMSNSKIKHLHQKMIKSNLWVK